MSSYLLYSVSSKVGDKSAVAGLRAPALRILEEADEKLDLASHEGLVLRGYTDISSVVLVSNFRTIKDILVSCDGMHADCAR